MKQVPYTTYRPVYRRETYTVPVTYTTQVAQPSVLAPAAECNTCTTGLVTAPVQVQAPVGTIAPNGTYYQSTPSQGGTVIESTVQPSTSGTPTPADLRPSLDSNSLQRPSLEAPSSSSSSSAWPPRQMQPTNYPSGGGISPMQDPEPAARWQENTAPQLLDPFNKTTRAPAVQPWNYSPVRLASFNTTESKEPTSRGVQEYVGNMQSQPAKQPSRHINEGWRSGSN